jgi:hypothetical protein
MFLTQIIPQLNLAIADHSVGASYAAYSATTIILVVLNKQQLQYRNAYKY